MRLLANLKEGDLVSVVFHDRLPLPEVDELIVIRESERQRLTKAGFIESIKGFNGGFKLVVNPADINFLEIYELFDGKIKVDSCLLTHQKCNGNCIFGDLICSINRQVKEKFESTKLSDLTD